MLYHKLVEEHLKDRRIIISDGSRSFTFRQLHDAAMEYCALFQRRRLNRGDRVLVAGLDPLETVIILLACIAEGYICVPMSGRLDRESRAGILRDCTPSLVIDGRPSDLAPAPSCRSRQLLDEDTPVYILYTSGSESLPKGVLAKQKQILFCCAAIQRRLLNNCTDRILCCLPISFDYGMYQVFLAFLSGAALYLDSGEIIQKIPYLLEHWEITAFPTTVTVANLLLRTNLLRRGMAARLRYITFTGEYLPLSLVGELRQYLPHVRIVPMYGLTECKRVSVMPPGRDDKIMAGSCGLPLDGISVRLERVDPHTGIGELTVEGDNVMEGYWGAAVQSSPTFGTNPKTGRRFVRTGDLFRMDSEGFLYFCGRKNGIIKVRGYRVGCGWLESRFQSVEGLLEAAIIGVPNELTGEQAVLIAHVASRAAEERVRRQMKSLPQYLWDTKIIYVSDPLPKTQNGKIDRQKLRQIAGELS